MSMWIRGVRSEFSHSQTRRTGIQYNSDNSSD
ncbi:hypothetical protein SNOG_01065 [Parastagonospora nodorum SN15]|uniref:Uncharacterized protein n=1 Tax=Phaeosphaeria nodorum (strain SN15 / ATCC MYA-4574 / FGSC 10173) TaxID=321614 RepID=Q0V4J9_PHANO|nr:hypothetical protein SNOG_01065 [Parastagonospora nodorum SN15]EAT92560.1 hypothetical protein SNOG_01065 [Parastagonospora nodorum SN15]